MRTSGKIKKGQITWTNQEELDSTAFVAYHGKSMTQFHFVKLICALTPDDDSPPERSFISTTGERVSATIDGIDVIPRERIWIGEEIKEVDFDYSDWNLINVALTKNKLKKHGIKISRNEEHEYKPLYDTNQKGSLANYGINLSEASMGQKTDIRAYRRKIERLQFQCPEVNKIVAYGISRGAATTFVAIAANKHENIALCILEAPPASMHDVIKEKVGKDLTPVLYNRTSADLVLGKQHNLAKNAQAQAYVDEFPDDIPLAIVSSQKDDLVPHQSSLKLALRVAANRLRKAREQGGNIEPVYFLQLDDSGHNDYTAGNSLDSQRYQNFTHALYKTKGLAYIEEYARLGEEDLKTADLVNGYLNQFILMQDDFRKNKNQNERLGLRLQAAEYFINNINVLPDNEKNRIASICAVMPLFSKQLGPFWVDTISSEELLNEQPSSRIPLEKQPLLPGMDRDNKEDKAIKDFTHDHISSTASTKILNEEELVVKYKNLASLYGFLYGSSIENVPEEMKNLKSAINTLEKQIINDENRTLQAVAAERKVAERENNLIVVGMSDDNSNNNMNAIIQSIQSTNAYLKSRSQQTGLSLFGYSGKDYLDRRQHWENVLREFGLFSEGKATLNNLIQLINNGILRFDSIIGRSHYADELKKFLVSLNDITNKPINVSLKACINNSYAAYHFLDEYDNFLDKVNNNIYNSVEEVKQDILNVRITRFEYRKATLNQYNQFITDIDDLTEVERVNLGIR